VPSRIPAVVPSEGKVQLISRLPAASKASTPLEPHDLSGATQIACCPLGSGTIAQHRPPAFPPSGTGDHRTSTRPLPASASLTPSSGARHHPRAASPGLEASPLSINPGLETSPKSTRRQSAVASFPMTGEHEPQRLPAYAQLQLPRKPPSPPAQHLPSPLNQPSPSTVQESPQQTPRPFDASGSAESTARKGMRSQIACARCRRSKTKCENTGQGTVCKACANTNRKCEWDHTAAVPSSTGSLRRDSTADDVSRVKPISTFAAIPRTV
jgi:hypothetical protein